MGFHVLRAPVAALRLGCHSAFPLEALLPANGAGGTAPEPQVCLTARGTLGHGLHDPLTQIR